MQEPDTNYYLVLDHAERPPGLWDLKKFQASSSFEYSLFARCQSSNFLNFFPHMGFGVWKNLQPWTPGVGFASTPPMTSHSGIP